MRFLLVDDNPDDRTFLAYSIADQSNHVVVEADSVADAVAKIDEAERTRGHFDAILLDLGLPDSHDPEATFHRVQLHAHPTPIVIYSGQEDLRVMPRLLKAGAANYLVKSPTFRATVALYLLEQAAREARTRSVADIERRTALKGVLAEAVSLRAPIQQAKSLPPAGVGSLALIEARIDALIATVTHLAERESQQTRAIARVGDAVDTGKHEVRRVQEEAERMARAATLEAREATLKARQSLVDAEEARADAAEARQEVQRLRDLWAGATPQNKLKLAGAGSVLVAVVMAVVRVLQILTEGPAP